MGDQSDGRNEVIMEETVQSQDTTKETEVPPIRKPTFKDKVLGAKPLSIPEEVDLLESGLMQMDLVEGNRLFPSFDMDDNAYKSICTPYEDCLVIKLLGKKIGYRLLCERLRSLWKLPGSFEVIEVHNGYFFVKFDSQDDKVKVLTGAPWMIFDHYLSVKPWTSEFVAADSKINTTAVWVRIPGLGLQFYHRKILMTLAKGLGKPIKVDMNTVDMQKGRFARVCVEIDLNQPVVGMLRLRGTWYKIEYEGLHLLCGTCGCYGHLTRNCSVSPVQTQATPSAAAVPDAAAAVTGHEEMTAQVDKPAEGLAVGGNPSQQSGVIRGSINAADKCPDAAHGEWLKVERKKNKIKKKAPIKESFTQFEEKGNKSKTAGNMYENIQKVGNYISKELPTFKNHDNKEIPYSGESVQYRKRPRNNKIMSVVTDENRIVQDGSHAVLAANKNSMAVQQVKAIPVQPMVETLAEDYLAKIGSTPQAGLLHGGDTGTSVSFTATMERRVIDNIVLPKDVVFKESGGK
ncbi:uncharacterized protein LOC130732924 [Lotus japonicus]|uniref:uncharacterized protein LOC130732924 n=1 Tax=Lotus japonicus TaxID=34305 RepID=UPI00258C1F1F|nr:uncharacterized protein LOC130732924 [Lotus japonicus]